MPNGQCNQSFVAEVSNVRRPSHSTKSTVKCVLDPKAVRALILECGFPSDTSFIAWKGPAQKETGHSLFNPPRKDFFCDVNHGREVSTALAERFVASANHILTTAGVNQTPRKLDDLLAKPQGAVPPESDRHVPESSGEDSDQDPVPAPPAIAQPALADPSTIPSNSGQANENETPVVKQQEKDAAILQQPVVSPLRDEAHSKWKKRTPWLVSSIAVVLLVGLLGASLQRNVRHAQLRSKLQSLEGVTLYFEKDGFNSHKRGDLQSVKTDGMAKIAKVSKQNEEFHILVDYAATYERSLGVKLLDLEERMSPQGKLLIPIQINDGAKIVKEKIAVQPVVIHKKSSGDSKHMSQSLSIEAVVEAIDAEIKKL